MNYETMNDQQIDKAFSQLIASAETSMGAPASWYLAKTTEEKRKIVIDNLAPKQFFRKDGTIDLYAVVKNYKSLSQPV